MSQVTAPITFASILDVHELLGQRAEGVMACVLPSDRFENFYDQLIKGDDQLLTKFYSMSGLSKSESDQDIAELCILIKHDDKKSKTKGSADLIKEVVQQMNEHARILAESTHVNIKAIVIELEHDHQGVVNQMTYCEGRFDKNYNCRAYLEINIKHYSWDKIVMMKHGVVKNAKRVGMQHFLEVSSDKSSQKITKVAYSQTLPKHNVTLIDYKMQLQKYKQVQCNKCSTKPHYCFQNSKRGNKLSFVVNQDNRQCATVQNKMKQQEDSPMA